MSQKPGIVLPVMEDQRGQDGVRRMGLELLDDINAVDRDVTSVSSEVDSVSDTVDSLSTTVAALSATVSALPTIDSSWDASLTAALGSGWQTAFASAYSAGIVASTGGYIIPGYGNCHNLSNYSYGGVAADTINGDSSYTKVAEYVAPATGTLTVKFKMSGSSSSITGVARIYKNGSGYGTARTNATGSYVAYSENLSFTAGDKIQLYAYQSSGSGSCGTIDFALCYSGYGKLYT